MEGVDRKTVSWPVGARERGVLTLTKDPLNSRPHPVRGIRPEYVLHKIWSPSHWMCSLTTAAICTLVALTSPAWLTLSVQGQAAVNDHQVGLVTAVKPGMFYVCYESYYISRGVYYNDDIIGDDDDYNDYGPNECISITQACAKPSSNSSQTVLAYSALDDTVCTAKWKGAITCSAFATVLAFWPCA